MKVYAIRACVSHELVSRSDGREEGASEEGTVEEGAKVSSCHGASALVADAGKAGAMEQEENMAGASVAGPEEEGANDS